MHPVIVKHVEKSMEKKGIDPRIVLVENDPKDSEEYMQDLYHPFENSPQIRPPTVEEVKHYLYQYMHKDFKFIRQFATARKTRQHGTPARMRQLNQFRNTGVRPDFPHPKWENLVLTNISKHGFTLEQVQESKDTRLVANLVLPPFENQNGAITMANKAQANRVLHHLILKTKKFSDEVLKHVRRVEPPSQTNSQDEGEYEEVSESSGPSENGSTAEEEEDEEDSVEAYRPEHTGGSSSGYVASPYHFQQQIPESAHMSQDQAFIGRFKEREKRQDEDHTEPSQVVRLSEIVQPSLQQKFAGYGASEDYFPCQLNREASPPESPSPQRQYDDSHPASSSDGQGRRGREGSHG